MRFSATAILCSLALSAGLTVAGPVSETSTPSLTSVGVAKVPEFKSVERLQPPSPAADGSKAPEVTIVGIEGETKGISKREEYNPLEERGPATLILCTGTSCNGRCFGVDLNSIRFNRCYATSTYYSLYVSSRTGLNYGVYVGRGCRGKLFYEFYSYTFCLNLNLIHDFSSYSRCPCSLREDLLQDYALWQHYLQALTIDVSNISHIRH